MPPRPTAARPARRSKAAVPVKPAPRGKARRKPDVAAPEPPALAGPVSARHREVLDAAAELMAERGYGGASLRELARRVGMSQPSLYHYFRTKEALALQILETLESDMIAEAPTALPDSPLAFPRLLADLVRRLYEGDRHPLYVRAVFALSRMDPRFGARNREIFVDSMLGHLRLGLAPYVARGELPEEPCVTVLRVLVHAVGFRLMEERVLFDARPLGPDVDAYIDLVVELAEAQIRALWRPTATA